jgi:hypothetical protein
MCFFHAKICTNRNIKIWGIFRKKKDLGNQYGKLQRTNMLCQRASCQTNQKNEVNVKYIILRYLHELHWLTFTPYMEVEERKNKEKRGGTCE